jgi:hypothetical protein
VKAELREQLAAKPTVVFVQYSLGHNEDEELPSPGNNLGMTTEDLEV